MYAEARLTGRNFGGILHNYIIGKPGFSGPKILQSAALR